MTLQMVKKPPTKTGFNERLKISLLGNHTFKQKAAMLLEAKFWLEHEHGIGNAGLTHVYIPLIDVHGYPLTHFANGDPIADWDLVINSPYHCAADDHRAG
jgi:hypothetical protein